MSQNLSGENILNENNLENSYMTPRNKPILLQNIHNQKHKYREYKKNLSLNSNFSNKFQKILKSRRRLF